MILPSKKFLDKKLQITYSDGSCQIFSLPPEELAYLYNEIAIGGSKNGMISLTYQDDFYLINIKHIQQAIFIEKSIHMTEIPC